MTGLHLCALCGHETGLPDSMWLTLAPLAAPAIAPDPVTLCSPRCAVLWLEREHKPSTVGIRL